MERRGPVCGAAELGNCIDRRLDPGNFAPPWSRVVLSVAVLVLDGSSDKRLHQSDRYDEYNLQCCLNSRK
jgi:hypothetical protein